MARLADVVNPLVVDEQGQLWPLAYGMSPQQRIAGGETTELRASIRRYLDTEAAPFASLLEEAFHELDSNHRREFVDWYGLLVDLSHRMPRGVPLRRKERCSSRSRGDRASGN